MTATTRSAACSDDASCGSSSEPFTQWVAMRSLVRLAVPTAAASIINVGADRATLAFVGQWDYADRSHFDGASVGKMFSNITGLSLGLATFCSQATGAGRALEMNAVFTRRCATVLGVLCCFSVLCSLFAEPFLLVTGQPADVARTSARFAQVQMLGVPGFWGWMAVNTTYNSMRKTWPGLLSSCISSLSQVILAVLFTHPKLLAMGYLGVALARSCGGWMSLIIILCHTKMNKFEAYIWRLHPEAEAVLRPGAIAEFLRVSVPSALIVWSEWWAFEVLSLFVGRTPNAEANLAAHGVMFNCIVIAYMTFTATSTCVCTLVGNKLGERRNEHLRPLLRAAAKLSLGTSLAVAITYELSKYRLARLFTQDADVRVLIETSSFGVVGSVPLYAQVMTFYGALRGSNNQRPGILGNLVGYWIVGLPLAAILGCRFQWPSALLGVWIGNVVALAIAAAWICSAVFIRIDWLSVRRVDTAAPLIADHRRACELNGAEDADRTSA
eukprot:TRINITY_DN27466_c0_g2_i1.p1 TRINITY_DN27466_c0_g2~~TRINITY_DN27466_c0_g2_i1.p1  ORF type:complete len:499 (-),score=55.95 TRINITY_DN27466_c0_g2_i1:44-1540(-)